MKKALSVLLAIGIALSIVLAISPKGVEAKDTSPAAGMWTTGTEVDVDDYATSPTEWMSLLTKGVRVTEPGLICHPFRGGQFNWVGEIRQLKNGNWYPLKTTNDWYPSKEGQFMSCAQAPSAGTYALFGYYDGTLAKPGFNCSTVDWGFDSGITNLPEGTWITVTIIDGTDVGDFDEYLVDYAGIPQRVLWGINPSTWPYTVQFVESTHGCSTTRSVEEPERPGR